MPWGWECLSLGRPSQAAVQGLLASVPSGAFNHAHAGATEHAPPLPAAVVDDHWVLDHNRVQVGTGKQQFQRAKRLIQQWRHMDLGWVQTNSPAISQGNKVCISARSLFIWNRLPLEIVYARSERAQLPVPPASCRSSRQLNPADCAKPDGSQRRGPAERFTFATSTTGPHQLVGEERFSIEWHQRDNSVWYEIYTISKPATPLARLTYPLVRFHQRHFARQSLQAMVKNLSETSNGHGNS